MSHKILRLNFKLLKVINKKNEKILFFFFKNLIPAMLNGVRVFHVISNINNNLRLNKKKYCIHTKENA